MCLIWLRREVAQIAERMRAAEQRERQMQQKLNLILAEVQGGKPPAAQEAAPKQLPPLPAGA